jgi:hypothetical protein
MRQERPDIDVPFCGPAILHARVMNDGDQTVAVLTDIKDRILLSSKLHDRQAGD